MNFKGQILGGSAVCEMVLEEVSKVGRSTVPHPKYRVSQHLGSFYSGINMEFEDIPEEMIGNHIFHSES